MNLDRHTPGPLLRRLVCAACLLVFPMVRADVGTPGTEISSPLQLAPWVALFAKVATAETLYSTFTEERFLPIRKTPTVLQGEMRFSRDRGLSLAYSSPEPQMMILDEQGLLLRDAKGRQKSVSADNKSAGIANALSAIMAFDWDEMQEQFLLRGHRQGQEWRLDLEPRSDAERKRLGTVTLWGEGDYVRRIQLQRSEKQRVVITIKDRVINRVFTPDEVRRYFR